MYLCAMVIINCSLIFLLDFETVLTLCYFVFHLITFFIKAFRYYIQCEIYALMHTHQSSLSVIVGFVLLSFVDHCVFLSFFF
jgi:hypothetical protein